MSSYEIPASLEQALELLARGPCTMVAGGTDFYPQLGDKPVDFNILDISQLDELKGINRNKEYWRIGAATTWTELIESELPSAFDALKLAAREVGSEQIQNAATVAGNLCNASPAADSVPPIPYLDARVELQSGAGVRELPLSEFILGNRRTALQAGEIMTAVLIPADRDHARSHFIKLGIRRYLVISITMVSVLLQYSRQGRVELARISVGSCSEVAVRLKELEEDITGKAASDNLGAVVSSVHLRALSPIDDVRAAAKYRTHAAEELVRRALFACSKT